MNVNKKLGRFKQWAGEKMGGEAKTDTSEDFKMLEAEMDLRYEGMDKMQKSMTTYVKWVGKRTEDREKMLPTTHLGATLVSHGQDFQQESEYGSCLTSIGRANEALARKQETYLAGATATWLEGLERSLAQMKEYQAARKKLETRRLAYDASLAKMQKAKKEDFRVEEELRAQKAKYEEANEDTYRRMMDIKEAEVESVADLTAFLDAELAYYDGCREILVQLKREWPGTADPSRVQRSRSNTARSYSERFAAEDESPVAENKGPAIPARGGRTSPPRSERPPYGRTITGDSGQPSTRESSPGSNTAGIYKLVRIPTEPTALVHAHGGQLRPVTSNSSDYAERADSPVSYTNPTPSRTASWSTVDSQFPGPKKTIPPPINRAKKPPPPPPMKRSALSTSQLSHSQH